MILTTLHIFPDCEQKRACSINKMQTNFRLRGEPQLTHPDYLPAAWIVEKYSYAGWSVAPMRRPCVSRLM
jgi:hypothetical protein